MFMTLNYNYRTGWGTSIFNTQNSVLYEPNAKCFALLVYNTNDIDFSKCFTINQLSIVKQHEKDILAATNNWLPIKRDEFKTSFNAQLLLNDIGRYKNHLFNLLSPAVKYCNTVLYSAMTTLAKATSLEIKASEHTPRGHMIELTREEATVLHDIRDCIQFYPTDKQN